MNRPLTLVGIGAAVALALAGCAASPPEETGGPVELTFWHGYTEADGDVLQQIVDDFNASQDDVKITTEVKTWAVIDDTLLPALSADEGPEIVAMPGERLPVYADRGAFVDLSGWYGGEDSNADALNPQAVEMVTVNGTPYGVPTGFVPLSVFYNKALFADAGIGDFPQTWDEWRTAATQLTLDSDGDGTPEQYGLALPDHDTVANGLWPTLFYGAGGELVQDADTAVIDSDANRDALEYWVSAIRDDKISPTGLDGIGADELFSSGKAAMHVGGPWMASIAADSGIDYGIAAVPAGPEGQAASAIGVAMGVTAQAAEAETAGAEAFFSYFFDLDVATQWSLGSGWPPLRTDVPAEAVAENAVVVSLTEIAPTSRALLPGVVNSVDVLDAVDDLTQRAVAGEDLDDLLPTAQDEIQAALQ
ncbi:multiple sugar transport system substrate-binding protein [Microbacterium trichothecenolyticum]|uniref:ABC transporter substrate-binding protein n=1 Tax=Microbacterium trichothecenolyticum TaxID=69370 RepID=UPI002854FA7C|nr:ABC transporter substrate-binding protein [Microbacterium trichothecenolyticum]MDR7187139.1 multiple sugar transport system substrate-binding protein [Microbacterium trichothecenolyticum]